MPRDPWERARARLAELAARSHDLPTFWAEATAVIVPVVPHYMSPCWYTLDPASLLATSHHQAELDEFPAEWLAI